MTDPVTPPPLPPPRTRWGVALGAGVLVLLIAALAWAVMGHREQPTREGPAPATLQPAGAEVAVVLDSAALRRADLQTATLGTAAGAVTGSVGGSDSGAVIGGASLALTGDLVADPGRITTIRAAVPGRLTAPGGRWPALGERVAAGTAVAQVSDARPLVAPRGGVVTAVNAQPGELVQAGQELLRLADLSELLARIAWRPDAPPPPASLRIVPLTAAASPDGAAGGVARDGGLGWPARLVGPAPEVDSLTRLPVYLYRLNAVTAGARPGLPVIARVPEGRGDARRSAESPASHAVLVPTDAVVQWEGLAWVYVQRAPGHFVRIRVDTGRPVRGGWLVDAAPAVTPNTLAVGDAVVIRGAQQLLSAEFRSQLPKDEDAT